MTTLKSERRPTIFILFPNQLFAVDEFPEEYIPLKRAKGGERGGRGGRGEQGHGAPITYFLIEHPIFFGFRSTMKMNFQKKKIVLHRASCLEYIGEMKRHGISIHLIDYNAFIRYKFKAIYDEDAKNGNDSQIVCFDPTDYELMSLLKKTFKDNLMVLESPNFLTHTADLIDYYTAGGGAGKDGGSSHFYHASFYKWQLDNLKIPHIRRTYDVENRDAIPAKMDASLPDVTKVSGVSVSASASPKYSASVSAAVKFCQEEFPKNYGSTDDFYLPTTRKEAYAWLRRFIQHRLVNFGKYQDAIVPGNPFLFHSIITPALNIGLISPVDVVKEAIQAYKRHKVPIEAYEGFIRQVIGWREYQRFIYLFLYKDIKGANFFGNTGRLTKHWYDGTTGLAPLDDAIQSAFKWGYINHIQRLMVVSNAMNLCEFAPDEAYRWFMEFSVDSYDWVMIGNVYSMGMWADGGLTMRKPYISSDKYLQTMSGNRYEGGAWEEEWKALYYRFLSRNAGKLRGTPYVRNLVHWNAMSQAEKRAINLLANKVIRRITR